MLAPHAVEALLADLAWVFFEWVFIDMFRLGGCFLIGEKKEGSEEGKRERERERKFEKKKNLKKPQKKKLQKKKLQNKNNNIKLTRASASRMAYHVDTHPVWWYDLVPFQPQ